MAKGYLETHTSTDEAALQKLENALGNYHDLEIKAQKEIFDLRKNNLERLAKLQVELINKEKVAELALAQQIQEAKIKNDKIVYDQRKKENADYQKKLRGATTDAEKNKIKKEHKENLKNIKEEGKLRQKGTEDRIKKEDALRKRQEQTAKANEILHDKNLSKQEKLLKLQTELGISEKEAKKLKTGETMAEAYKALANFAKQLEGTINTIAGAQTAIDTRLYGSKNDTKLGSYWKRMSADIVKYVGMSPIIKQSAVVDNLKTMVGQGISFNVEQRAVLMTLKDGVATTFNALDSSLTKLVRIQQEDTTASRLGMEAALNAFLNNMYETTEYMQSAAADIRAQIYEASALMTAKSATEFEYQVQKWMGSLYSVGFNNSSGLAGALGKLAAGDISGVTDGGYGNLLVMAANKAGLSISEILAEGLDSSSTNQLMEAMVGYLGQIYNETKGSNLLAQQYASVFGLTASDLKAAANLSNSLSAISSPDTLLTNNDMLQNLYRMTNSMWTRTSTGGMMTNLFDNLKYATANTMANDPVLYATYTIASMLDDTVGGISFGNALTGQYKVSDIMRIATLGAGLLGGVGTMISGLVTGNGIGSSALLKNFGIGTGNNVVTRGTGAGLITTSGVTTSESGSMVGNADGSAVQNKTMTDATDSAKQQVAEAQEPDAVELKDVNAQVIKIAELLEKVTDGTAKFHVDIDDTLTWTMPNGTTGSIF